MFSALVSGLGAGHFIQPNYYRTLVENFLKVGEDRNSLSNLQICRTSTAIICVTVRFSQPRS